MNLEIASKEQYKKNMLNIMMLMINSIMWQKCLECYY